MTGSQPAVIKYLETVPNLYHTKLQLDKDAALVQDLWRLETESEEINSRFSKSNMKAASSRRDLEAAERVIAREKRRKQEVAARRERDNSGVQGFGKNSRMLSFG